MDKKNKISKIILAILVLITSFFSGFGISTYIHKTDEVNWAVDKILKHYYAIDPITGEKIELTEEDIINAITYTLLDDYSTYYNPQELVEYKESRQGKTYGIGLQLTNTTLGLKISRVVWNSPLDKACLERGIDPNGKIIKAISNVDGTNMVNVSTYAEFSSAIEVYQQSVKFNLYFDDILDPVAVSREDFIESYVRYYDNNSIYAFISDYGVSPSGVELSIGKGDLPDDTAYIVFTRFNGGADEQFKNAMLHLKDAGKTKLILDMRSNGGGYMDTLTKVASYLINNNGQGNTLVALAKYKNGSTAKYSFNNNNYVPLDKLTVIANEYSASATECLIGALLTYGDLSQDNLIVTSQTSPTSQNATYGKGIMQTTYYGPKNNAIKLTTAYIYWPDGTTNIHGKGIKANVENSVIYEDGYARALAVSNG